MYRSYIVYYYRHDVYERVAFLNIVSEDVAAESNMGQYIIGTSCTYMSPEVGILAYALDYVYNIYIYILHVILYIGHGTVRVYATILPYSY